MGLWDAYSIFWTIQSGGTSITVNDGPSGPDEDVVTVVWLFRYGMDQNSPILTTDYYWAGLIARWLPGHFSGLAGLRLDMYYRVGPGTRPFTVTHGNTSWWWCWGINYVGGPNPRVSPYTIGPYVRSSFYPGSGDGGSAAVFYGGTQSYHPGIGAQMGLFPTIFLTFHTAPPGPFYADYTPDDHIADFDTGDVTANWDGTIYHVHALLGHADVYSPDLYLYPFPSGYVGGDAHPSAHGVMGIFDCFLADDDEAVVESSESSLPSMKLLKVQDGELPYQLHTRML